MKGVSGVRLFWSGADLVNQDAAGNCFGDDGTKSDGIRYPVKSVDDTNARKFLSSVCNFEGAVF